MIEPEIDGIRERRIWKQKVKNWHDRMEKATMNISAYLYQDLLMIIKEMEVELE